MNALRPSLALLLILAAFAVADEPDAVQFSVTGARFNWAVVPTGVDVLVKAGPWSAQLGAGYENLQLGRGDGLGAPLSLPATEFYQTYNSPNGQADLRYNLTQGSGKLWLGLAGRVYGNVEPVASSHFPDRNGALFASVKAGATWNTLTKNAHGVPSGETAQLSAEWAPTALSAQATDYARVDLVSNAFVPLFDAGGVNNLLSGYAAFRVNARWLDGQQVPVALLEPTEVRGYSRFLDTKVRTVATAEVRVNGPSLWGVADVLPIVLVFAEGGLYSGYADTSTSAKDASGALASVGAGLGVDLFGLGTPILTVGLPLLETDQEPATLWYAINFSLRF